MLIPLLAAPAALGQASATSGQSSPTSQSSGSTNASQNPASSPAAPDNKPAEPKAELTSKDTTTTFKIRVNLVQVKAVVRDSKGNLIEDLKREDFEVYDQGKLQVITNFAVETAESRKKRIEEAAKTQQDAEESGKELALPERFVALMFDDIHLQTQDAMTVRNAAKNLIDSMAPTDRLGIFTTSEELKQDFTSDKAVLERILNQVVPRPKMGKINSSTNCPDVTYYMADESLDKSDPTVLPVVTQETLQCMFQGNPQYYQQAQTIAASALQQALVAGDADNNYTYRALEDVLRRLAQMPGERVMVLASPGFVLSTQQYLDETGIVDRANRMGVVINTVDARGLYAPDILGDISQPNTDTPQTANKKQMYREAEQTEDAYVLGDFAYGTGGTFFQNSNDLAGGLNRAGGTPEVMYVLGFSPANPKMDGKYHTIKVVITDKRKYSVQARRGYYAPRKANDPGEQAKAEIQEAVFSQDEIQELPLDLQTQYFRTGDTSAHLSVVSKIDVKGMHFRKADGRNYDDLTVATVVFDENGNFVTGGEKILEMRLLDKTYERMSQTGLVMKSSFDLKPGKYMVRQVIRDSEGAQMSAKSGSVLIPE